MFAAHPELPNVFNEMKQAIGEQPKALAASGVAFAVHLINPDAPDFTPFMQISRKTLMDQGVPSGAIHYEVFGPDMWTQNPDA